MPAEREDRLDAAIAEFLRAEEAGEHLDADEWVGRHPELADDLREFLDDRKLVGRRIALALPESGTHYGPYRILRVIGRGGMGIVFEAQPLADDRHPTVALKALPSACLTEPDDIERFLREAEIVARLNHPNIVRLLDAGTQAGIPYYTMTLIDGPDLRTVLHELRRSRREGTPDAKTYPVALPGLADDAAPLGCDAPWRAIARIGLQAARALSHAHERGILHRDVKPSNLLLDHQGIVYLTDFGLARSEAHPDLSRTDELAGALRFMAPERFHRWCDPRSDLYSLGLTLYELLTLRPAFEAPSRARMIQAVLTTAPTHPRKLNRAIPRDLETIVLKAIEKEPAHRYPTADAMADDLERFLEGRPILARRVNLVRRGWSWARRNRFRAAALAAGILAIVGFIGGAFYVQYVEKVNAETQALLLRLQRFRHDVPVTGWRGEVRSLVKQVKPSRRDKQLRDETVALLGGFDATRLTEGPEVGASSLAFSADGKLLLMGGVTPDKEKDQDGRAGVWDIAQKRFVCKSNQVGPGPVAFDADQTPLQLVYQPSQGLILWDVKQNRRCQRFTLPDQKPPALLALTPDARIAAATVAVGSGLVLVWDARTGSELRRIEATGTALALAPDGSMLVLGDAKGHVHFWRLDREEAPSSLNSCESARQTVVSKTRPQPPGLLDRPEDPLNLSTHGNRILSLAVGRDPWLGPNGEQGWLVAAGEDGGTVFILDAARRGMRSFCPGSQYQVKALAFSPDGSILASGGRSDGHLWDVVTGSRLLDIAGPDEAVAVAFSPDGRRLTLGCPEGHPKYLCGIWELERGQGIRTYLGLNKQVAQVVFSPDGTLLAAQSHDYRIAVWELATGRLRFVVELRGDYADNVGLAFRADGRQLAASVGTIARVWDTETGQVVRSWSDLPPGITSELAFPAPDRLILFRFERKDGLGVPYGEKDHKAHPHIVRVRNIWPEDRPILREVEGFHRLNEAALTPDGHFALFSGWPVDGPPNRQEMRILDLQPGSTCNITRHGFWGYDGYVVLDPAGQTALYCPTEDGADMAEQIHVRTGKPLRRRLPHLTFPGANGTLWAMKTEESDVSGSQWIEAIQSGSTSYTRFLLQEGSTRLVAFHTDAHHFAWGRKNGLVLGYDLTEIRRQLKNLGMDW